MSDGIWFQEEWTSTNTMKFEPKEIDTLLEVKYILGQLQDLLEEKNKAYGDSALNPIRLFSKAGAAKSLCVRIDEKLGRIKNRGVNEDTEDTLMDLMGYLVLLKIAIDRESRGPNGPLFSAPQTKVKFIVRAAFLSSGNSCRTCSSTAGWR